jgi:NDP-4-keto-2,6-dideoxyhexose 3-C-methyltransferase
MAYQEIQRCRICGNTRLETILDLGMQALTGVFPRPGEIVESTPVVLVKCHAEGSCGLVQIKHSVSLEQMYGENYGYRSGLNRSMVEHLMGMARYCSSRVKLSAGDLVLDIGSNDGTLLRSYLALQAEGVSWNPAAAGSPTSGLAPAVPEEVTFVGMDPTIRKFGKYYDERCIPIADFFNSKAFYAYFRDVNRKAKIITSIACFYDLEDPVAFARDIKKVLHPDGIWVFEQSYSLLMLAKNMYDTAVQEHIEYYSLAQISRILKDAGLSVREVELNDCNGGSFRIVAEHARNSPPNASVLQLEQQEKIMGLDGLAIYKNFENNAQLHKANFRKLLQGIKDKGQTVYGLGASTKFNAVLQYCEITPALLPKIGEVNPDKFGCTTPGSLIPIVSEQEVFDLKPDYLVVGPYHFRDFLLQLPHVKKYLEAGGKLVFPLPSLEIVSK